MTKYNGVLKTKKQAQNWIEVLRTAPYNLEAKGLISILENKWKTLAAQPAEAERAYNLVNSIAYGPQEPPQDYRIYNRRMPDGSFRPLAGFFDRD